MLFVGWADPRKDAVTAVAAHQRVLRSRPDIRLVLVGHPHPVFAPVTLPDLPGVVRLHHVPDRMLAAPQLLCAARDDEVPSDGGTSVESRMLTHRGASDTSVVVDSESSRSEVLLWCVVANVARETAHGEGGVDLRNGLRWFHGGAKVWVLPPQWGDGAEQLFVVGHKRGRQYTRVVVARRHLERFRVEGVYSPTVMRELSKPWNPDLETRLWSDREEAREFATAANELVGGLQVTVVDAWGNRILWQDLPPDIPRYVAGSPPSELVIGQGGVLHLARIDGYRAVYTTLRPPEETSGMDS